MGKTARQAALDGAREITFAATAATISVIAVFVPVLLVSGFIGVFLFQFGMTISTAVGALAARGDHAHPDALLAVHDREGGRVPLRRFRQPRLRRLRALLRPRAGAQPATIAGKSCVGALALFALSLLFRHVDQEGIHARRRTSASSSSASRRRSAPRSPSPATKARGAGEDPQGRSRHRPLLRQRRRLRGRRDQQGHVVHLAQGPRASASRRQQQVMDSRPRRDQEETSRRISRRSSSIPPAISAAPSAGTNIELSVRGPDYGVLKEKVAEMTKTLRRQRTDDRHRHRFPRRRRPRCTSSPTATRRRRAASACRTSPTRSTRPSAACARATSPTASAATTCASASCPSNGRPPSDIDKLLIRTSYGELIPLSSVTQGHRGEKAAHHHARNARARDQHLRQHGHRPVARQGDGLRAQDREGRAARRLPPRRGRRVEGRRSTPSRASSSRSCWAC